MIDNFRPHRPTFVTVLIVVLLLFGVYHFTLGKRR